MANFRKLSPQAKKAALIARSAPRDVTAVVELSAGYTPDKDLPLEALQATVQGWSAQSRVATLTLGSNQLEALSDTKGVTYVELGDALSNPGEPPRPGPDPEHDIFD